MAIDHFKKHKHTSKIDWNFNLLSDNQPSIAALAERYYGALQHSGLYDPIPTKWLHVTILRVGLLEEYTEQEMVAVAEALEQKLENFQLPEFQIDSWWLWGGNVVFHISPDDEFNQLYEAVHSALKKVVGELRATKTPHQHFIPHLSLAYTRSHEKEKEINNRLMSVTVEPTTFKATGISLLKQWPTGGHYEWEIIRRVNIGK